MVSMDEAMYSFHQESGVPVSPYSAQSKGYFSRWRNGSEDAVVKLSDGERNRSIARRLDELAPTLGIPATELSVALLGVALCDLPRHRSLAASTSRG